MTEDRRAVLESIAFGPDSTPTERLKALEMLGGGPLVDDRTVFDFSGLSGEALDREVAGFFSPGAPGPGNGGEPLPAKYERRVARQVKARVHRILREFDERVEQAARAMAERMTMPDNVVPLRPDDEPEPSEEPHVAEQDDRERELTDHDRWGMGHGHWNDDSAARW